MSQRFPVVLEHLAATGWFAQHGEVALTSGLTLCLEKDPAAAAAFMNVIRGHTMLPAPIPDRWQAEAVEQDLSRVDVTGWVDAGATRLRSFLLRQRSRPTSRRHKSPTMYEINESPSARRGSTRVPLSCLSPRRAFMQHGKRSRRTCARWTSRSRSQLGYLRGSQWLRSRSSLAMRR